MVLFESFTDVKKVIDYMNKHNIKAGECNIVFDERLMRYRLIYNSEDNNESK